jgi:hypothetical protein
MTHKIWRAGSSQHGSSSLTLSKADIKMEKKRRCENVKLTSRRCLASTCATHCAADLSFKVQIIFLILCSSARLGASTFQETQNTQLEINIYPSF